MTSDEQETAEFIGGDQDGRTVQVSGQTPHIISMPRLSRPLVLADLDAVPSESLFLEVDDYELIGRNDAGHLRYMLQRAARSRRTNQG